MAIENPSPADLIACSRSILQFTEEALTLMREACAAIVVGQQTVGVAELQRVIAVCDVVIAQAKVVRAQHPCMWDGQPPPSRVM